MDYQEAKDRLEKPRDKKQKKIGHELELYRSPPYYRPESAEPGGTPPPPIITLKYFKTDVLTYYPDGGVRIQDGGWITSQCTRDKINEYLPRGWRLSVFNLRYAPRRLAGVLTIRSGTWEKIAAYPYSSYGRYYEKGRSDVTYLNAYDAWDLKDRVQAYAADTTLAFLSGKLPHTGHEDFSNRFFDSNTLDGQKERTVLDVLDRKISPASLMAAICSQELSIPHKSQVELFWAENYPFTGKAKTDKARVDQLEWLMRNPEIRGNHLRPPGNSRGYHSLKKDLLTSIEVVLLENLGFDIRMK